MQGPRHRKLAELAAHIGDVRCVRVGRKTAGVLVTGGDDKRVNVFIIGKTTASFSLAGHQSSVESVCFDNDEMVVAAGGSNGSIKVFELQSGKVTKSMSGHKANVTCLAWHPYNATMMSGSMDTNVKLWSLREKEAIATFKGHNTAVTHVRYSPDGNWIASASVDGTVKLWDVRTNKLVSELIPKTDPKAKYEITGLEFSPTEYLLATSSNKYVKIWDLESFEDIHTTSPEATTVRNIAFSKDGKFIFSALQDGCRVWTVDPPEAQDYVDVPWYKVSDLLVGEYRGRHRLLGCSFHSTLVGLFEIPLRNMRPFNEDPYFMGSDAGGSIEGNPVVSRSNLLGVASANNLPPEAALRRMSLNDRNSAPGAGAAGPSGYNGGGAYGNNGSRPHSGGQGEYPAGGGGMGRPVERPSGSAGRLPPASGAMPALPGNGARPAANAPPQRMPSSSNRYADVSPATSQDFGGPGDSADYPGPSRYGGQPAPSARPPMVSIGVGVGESLMRGQLQPEDLQRAAAAEPSRSRAQGQPRQRPFSWSRDQQGPDGSVPPYGQPSAVDQRSQWGGGLGQGGSAGAPPGADWRGGGGSAFDAGGGGGGAVYRNSDGQSDLEAVAAFGRQHQTIMQAMRKRAHTLSLVRNFVAKCDWRGAISCARRCDDPPAFVEVLGAMLERRDAFTLDLVGEVVSVLDVVFTLPADRQLEVGLDVVALHARAFGPVIRDLCGPAARGVGIDLSFEERRERANKARLVLQNLAPKLKSLARQNPALSSRAQDLAAQLSQL